jgi:hypothetical protein
MKLVIAALALTAAAAPAAAATLERPFQFTRALGEFSGVAATSELLSKFDSSLGSLTKVELRSKLTYTLDLSWDIQGEGGYVSLGEVWARALTADRPGDPAPFYLVNNLPADGTRWLGLGVLTAGSGQVSLAGTVEAAQTITDSENLAGLTGPGEFLHEGLGIFYHEWEAFGPMTGPRSRSQQGTYLLEGSYVFHYAPVPEPTAWAMMISGFGAVGQMSRRRRAAAA